MNIEQTYTDDGIAVIAVDGRLNVSGAPAVRRAADEAIGEGHARLAVDLSQTEFIDSSGLGALVGALRAARTAGGDLRLVGATAQVKTVLSLTSLDRVLRVFDSASEAYRY